jgi:DNA modification methylase
MKLEKIKISELKPHPKNYNTHPESQIRELAESLDRFQQFKNIVIDENNVILAGHGLVEAAKYKDMDSIHCYRAAGLSEHDKLSLVVADNELPKGAEPDLDLLKSIMEELDNPVEIPGVTDQLLEELGIGIGADIEEGLTDDDSIPDESEVESICKAGDLWQLGEHRLLCGDCTDTGNIERLMDGEKADLLLTDPPYGIDVVQSNQVGGKNIVPSSTYRKIEGDQSTDLAKDIYETLVDKIENIIMFGGNYFTDFLPPSRCWVIWDKKMTGNFSQAEMAWTSFNTGGIKIYDFMWNGLSREGSRKDELTKRVHPTQKPVGLFEMILNDYSKENQTILDPFGGSGTTLIACEKTNRKCRMCEIDEKYCDVIINRWEQWTGKKAVKI